MRSLPQNVPVSAAPAPLSSRSAVLSAVVCLHLLGLASICMHVYMHCWVGIFSSPSTILLKNLPRILIETTEALTFFVFTLPHTMAVVSVRPGAKCIGRVASILHQLNVVVQNFSLTYQAEDWYSSPVVLQISLVFVGTFMDAVPAMILFVPIILPVAYFTADQPDHPWSDIVVVTLAFGLVTPPYGLCLLIASSISGITIEDAI